MKRSMTREAGESSSSSQSRPWPMTLTRSIWRARSCAWAKPYAVASARSSAAAACITPCASRRRVKARPPAVKRRAGFPIRGLTTRHSMSELSGAERNPSPAPSVPHDMQRLLAIALTAGLLAVPPAASAAAQDVTDLTKDARLLRFPDVHGDTIAFSHGGDLWTVPAAGGTARRLTTGDGLELFPRFSPDGKWIAFTGPVRRDDRRLRHAGRRGRAAPAHLVPLDGPVRADGPRQPRPRLDARREDPLPRPAGADPRLRRRAVRRLARGRAGRTLPAPRGGRHQLLARREEDRLQPDLPRLPHVEALQGRDGPGRLGLRPRARRRSRRSPTGRAPTRSRCGSAARSTSSPTATAGRGTSGSTTSRRRRRRGSRRSPSST